LWKSHTVRNTACIAM